MRSARCTPRVSPGIRAPGGAILGRGALALLAVAAAGRQLLPPRPAQRGCRRIIRDSPGRSSIRPRMRSASRHPFAAQQAAQAVPVLGLMSPQSPSTSPGSSITPVRSRQSSANIQSAIRLGLRGIGAAIAVIDDQVEMLHQRAQHGVAELELGGAVAVQLELLEDFGGSATGAAF